MCKTGLIACVGFGRLHQNITPDLYDVGNVQSSSSIVFTAESMSDVGGSFPTSFNVVELQGLMEGLDPQR